MSRRIVTLFTCPMITSVFRTQPGKLDSISLINHDHHSYIPFKAIVTDGHNGKSVNRLACFGVYHPENQALTWPYIKLIIDRVHKHVCGHAAYSDIRTLLTRIAMWTQTVQHYLDRVTHSCHNCVQSSRPEPTRKMSLSYLDSVFVESLPLTLYFRDYSRSNRQ